MNAKLTTRNMRVKHGYYITVMSRLRSANAGAIMRYRANVRYAYTLLDARVGKVIADDKHSWHHVPTGDV